jgi:DnaJ homolog subfamily B member 12
MRLLKVLACPDDCCYSSGLISQLVVSRAFQILSDPDKKSRFDQFGGDPDNRFSSSSAGPAPSPFSGFARSPGGRNPMFDAEISPEDLFNQFFGGGMGGGFTPFGEFNHGYHNTLSKLY